MKGIRQTKIAHIVIEQELATGELCVFVEAKGQLNSRKYTEVKVGPDGLGTAIGECLHRASGFLAAREDVRASNLNADYKELQRDLGNEPPARPRA